MAQHLPALIAQGILSSEGGGGLTAVDWTLTIATWVTFGLLVFLLARFAWGPVVAAIDAREARIRADVERAEHARVEAERILKEYEEKMAEARREAEEIIARGREDAERAHRERVERAEVEARRHLEKALRSIDEERARAAKELRRYATEAAVDLARRILKSEIDAGKHRNLLEEFTRQ